MITKQAVLDYFVTFNEDLEGIIPHLYQDSVGLVTVGMGNLMEPIQLGLGLPWRRADGNLANQLEFIKEWNLINDTESLAKDGWRAAKPLCKLHLSREDIISLIHTKMASNEEHLIRRGPAFASLCADAQLMLHSWAWAVGPDATYPRMLKLINNGEFYKAITECDINPKRGTIILRNERNKQLLMNAQWLTGSGNGDEVLMYPHLHDGTDFDHTVTGLQHALALLGFSIAQDGIMGPKTKTAVEKFQGIHKLKVDGIAGPVTWATLRDQLRFR